MAGARQSIDIDATPEVVFAVITDYEAYPDILAEMESARIRSRTGNTVEADFTINLIKRVSYTLALRETPPLRLEWETLKGPFKTNTGSWTLERRANGFTRAHYEVEVKVGVFVPKSISNRVVGRTLPALLESFKRRAEQVATGYSDEN